MSQALKERAPSEATMQMSIDETVRRLQDRIKPLVPVILHEAPIALPRGVRMVGLHAGPRDILCRGKEGREGSQGREDVTRFKQNRLGCLHILHALHVLEMITLSDTRQSTRRLDQLPEGVDLGGQR